MLSCASAARTSMGGPALEHTTLAALCYSDRQHSAQLWQNRAAVHFPTFLWPAPWMQINPPPPPRTPPALQNITRLPLQAPYHPPPPPFSTPTYLTVCGQTSHLSRRPLAAPSDYIKKSSPLSGPSWPCYTKCYCQGQLVRGERRGCCYCLGFYYKQTRSL